MARVHHSFTMDVPPARAQELFVRDIVPDLHRDGSFLVYREEPGELRLSDADFLREHAQVGRWYATGFEELEDLADPDEFEAHDEEAGEPALADVLRRGSRAETPAASGQRPVLSLVGSHRLKIAFAPDGAGSRLTVKGSAPADVAHGLERLGRPDHWPAVADQPHG